MRFATAVGILALSEQGVFSAKWRNENRRMKSESNSLTKKIQSNGNSIIRSSIHKATLTETARVLTNDVSARQMQTTVPVVECDPAAADLGILACGVAEYCQPVKSDMTTNSLGGVCESEYNIFDLVDEFIDDIIDYPCNSSSFIGYYFFAGVATGCDCTNFDQSSSTGSFTCDLGLICSDDSAPPSYHPYPGNGTVGDAGWVDTNNGNQTAADGDAYNQTAAPGDAYWFGDDDDFTYDVNCENLTRTLEAEIFGPGNSFLSVCNTFNTSFLQGTYCCNHTITDGNLTSACDEPDLSGKYLHYLCFGDGDSGFNCDCSGLDDDNTTGTVECVEDGYSTPYCFDLANTTCANETLQLVFTDGEPESQSLCYDFFSPYSQRVCYLYSDSDFFSNMYPENGECGISFNGVLCNSCLYTSYDCKEFDCSNTEGMHAGNTCEGNNTMPILDGLNLTRPDYDLVDSLNQTSPGDNFPFDGTNQTSPGDNFPFDGTNQTSPVDDGSPDGTNQTSPVDDGSPEAIAYSEFVASVVESGDLTEQEVALVEPAVAESISLDSPNGFFSGAVDVDPSLYSEITPANANTGTFQLDSTFTPAAGESIPEDLKFRVYHSTDGRKDEGPVNADGSFSIDLDFVQTGNNLYLITFSSLTTSAVLPLRRQRSLSTSITTTMSLWVQKLDTPSPAAASTTGAPSGSPTLSTTPSIAPIVSPSSPRPSSSPSEAPVTNPTNPPDSSARALVSSKKQALSLIGLSAAVFMYFAC